jgi:hypothetical protein
LSKQILSDKISKDDTIEIDVDKKQEFVFRNVKGEVVV